MVEIPRLPDPPPGRDFPDGDGVGWWWYAHPGFEPPLYLLYFRTPSGRIGCMRKHAISPVGIVTPSIKVSWMQDGREVEDWHVGPPSRLIGWGLEDSERYARQAQEWPRA